jgi:hypothetical protein
MSQSIKKMFDNKHISEPRKVIGEYSFYLEGASTRVSIRISHEFNPPNPEYQFHFELSHYIHTPTQAGPYITSSPWSTSEDGALHRAINVVLPFYTGAIEAGHTPSESWLVKNEYF